MRTKKTIGREDKIDFLELGLRDVEVKFDTGAFTSVIHCSEIEEKYEEGKNHLEFKLFDKHSPEIFDVTHQTRHYKKRRIKNSFGTSEERFVIETSIIIYDELFHIELSLTDRGKMNIPVLLGRRFINTKFVIDPTLKDLSYKQKNKLKI